MSYMVCATAVSGGRVHSLRAAMLKRLLLRLNYDDDSSPPYQGIPEDNHTAIVAHILDGPGIELRLRQLGYRTLDFEEIRAEGDYQGTAVLYHRDEDVPWIRISEHKHFSPWEAGRFADTVCFREYGRLARPADTPYDLICLVQETRMLADHVALARQPKCVSFVGWLATCHYLGVDVTIGEAIDAATEGLIYITIVVSSRTLL